MYQKIAHDLSGEISVKQKEIVELEVERQSLMKMEIKVDKDYKRIITEYLSFKKPDRALLANIIDKILIDENKKIDIYYKIKLTV